MEGTLSEAESAMAESGEAADPAVGAALLLSDLEAAIATAGDEIAALRRVADTMPPAPLFGPALVSTEAEPVIGANEVSAPPPSATAVAQAYGAEPAAEASAVGRFLPGREVERAPPLPAESPEPELRARSVAPEADVVVDRSQAAQGWSDLAMSGSSVSALSPTYGTAVAEFAHDEAQPRASVQGAWSIRELPAGKTLPAAAPAVEPVESVVAPIRSPDEPEWSDRSALDSPALEAVANRPAAPSAGFMRDTQNAVELGTWTEPEAGKADRATAASASSAVSGPTEGDVFLDGERVGRWMARHLSRELGGPAASGTAFDPRIGPAWPGTLHGN